MRIKKKYVILESRLIDVTSEFSPQEKRILEMLYKKYGDSNINFNQWDVAAELIEDFNLDYESAYSLTKTFSWSARELFSPHKSLRKKDPIYRLFHENLSSLVSEFSKLNENNYEVNLHFDGDVGAEPIEDRIVSLSSGFRGFYMYISLPNYQIDTQYRRHYLTMDAMSSRTLSLSMDFFPIDLDGNKIERLPWQYDENENQNVNQNEFKVISSYSNVLGDINDREKIDLTTFNVPYPTPMTKENIFKTFDLTIKDVLNKLSEINFKLPEGIEPINITN
jgi:hypothetical protein